MYQSQLIKFAEYLPPQFRRAPPPEWSAEHLGRPAPQHIVRRLRLVGQRLVPSLCGTRRFIELDFENANCFVYIDSEQVMRFDTEALTAREYLARVIERGDLIDVVVKPVANAEAPVILDIYWIHIRYAEGLPGNLRFSRKDDGLFALRCKAGEKAERFVQRDLKRMGHAFGTQNDQTPGYFEIRYSGKRARQVDLTCLECGLTVEVKKRNKDRLYRISHSATRPFGQENRKAGWHAFVFPDMSLHYVSNEAILEALRMGRFRPGQDAYDQWVDIEPAAILESGPPHCRCSATRRAA